MGNLPTYLHFELADFLMFTRLGSTTPSTSAFISVSFHHCLVLVRRVVQNADHILLCEGMQVPPMLQFVCKGGERCVHSVCVCVRVRVRMCVRCVCV